MMGVGSLMSSSRGSGEGGTVAFTPLSLSPIAWWDPSDLTTLWQDTAGTTPITTDGQTVARMDDKSGNARHLLQGTAASRPVFKTSGGINWLEFSTSSKEWDATTTIPALDNYFAIAGVNIDTGGWLLRWNVEMLGIYSSGTFKTNSSVDTTQATYSLATPTGAVILGKSRTRNSASGLNTYKNGTLIDTKAAANSQVSSSVFSWTHPAAASLGKFYGYVLLSSVPSAQDRTSLTQWMATKSGVTL